jgi:hypothetical protein
MQQNGRIDASMPAAARVPAFTLGDVTAATYGDEIASLA